MVLLGLAPDGEAGATSRPRQDRALTAPAPLPSISRRVTQAAGKDQRIQALRGLAAMLVVVLHARQALDWAGYPPLVLTRIIPDKEFGAFGVDLFFVISGVVMGMALERGVAPRSFLRARFIRVVPFFWLAAVFAVLLSLLLGERPPVATLANSVTILPLFDSGVIDLPVPAVGWTLAFELYFYLIVAAALLLPGRMRFPVVVGILILGAAIGEVIQPMLAPMHGIAFNPILLEFALGLAVGRVARHPITCRWARLLIVTGLCPLLLSAAVDPGFSSAPEAVVAGQTGALRFLAWGLPSALLLAGLLATPDRLRSHSLLARLGDASYSIYLVHGVAITAMLLIWLHTGAARGDICFWALVAGGAFAGLTGHRWVERPLLAHLRANSGPTGIPAELAT
jgi:exopolysaccharide production protein ExoZ